MGKYCLRYRMCSHIFALIEGKGLSRMYGLGKKMKPNVLSNTLYPLPSTLDEAGVEVIPVKK